MMSVQLSPPPLVLSVGARCAMARNALQVAMLTRARKIEPRASELYDAHGHRVRLYLVRDIPEDVHGFDRLVALGVPALREAFAGAVVPPDDAERKKLLDGPLPLFLALPDADRPDADPRFERELVTSLSTTSGVPIDFERSRTFLVGHAGFVLALEAAVKTLLDEKSGVAMAMVGGIDSFYDDRVLDWLDEAERRTKYGVPQGFVPGEGAAFLLLARPRARAPEKDARCMPLGRVLAVTTTSTHELGISAGIKGEIDPAQAAMDAVRGAIAVVKSSPPWVLYDGNGEAYRTWEWSKVSRETLRGEKVEQSFAPDVGDVGAATGPMLATIACASWRVRCAPASQALIALHSDFGQRGAFVMEALPVPDPAVDDQAARPSQTQRIARASRAVFGRILDLPHGIPRALLCRALDDLWIALGRLETVEALDPASIEWVDDALRKVAELKALLEKSTGDARKRLERVAVSVTQALQTLLDTMLKNRSALMHVQRTAKLHPCPFVASIETPRLHPLPQACFRPFQWYVSFERADETSVDDDEDEDDEDEDSEEGRERQAETEATVEPEAASPATDPELREVARRCMEDIGYLSWLRRVKGNTPWSPSLGAFEQRLLNNLDALISLGYAGLPGTPHGQIPCLGIDISAEILRYTSESFTDESRAFVRAFVLGSIEGLNSVRSAVLGVRQSHPMTYDAQREAFSLAPNPHIRLAMDELCRDDDPRLVSLAIDVLQARKQASFASTVALLKHPNPKVCGKAATGLSSVPERDLALRMLDHKLYEATDEDVALAMAESMSYLGANGGMVHARDRLKREIAAPGGLAATLRSGLIRLLALGGSAWDVDLLCQSVRTAEDIEWLGWFGQVTLVDALIRMVDGAMDAHAAGEPGLMRRAAARALHRILGSLQEGSHGPESSRAQSSSLVLDGARWRKHWTQHGDSFGARTRLRYGRPLSIGVVLDELARANVTHEVRVVSRCELAILSQTGHEPWVDDWVCRQLEQVKFLSNGAEKLPVQNPIDKPGSRRSPACTPDSRLHLL